MAKVASKTNPTRKKGSRATKLYNGKAVQPFRLISRHNGGKNLSYMSVETETGEVIMGKDGFPLRWDSI